MIYMYGAHWEVGMSLSKLVCYHPLTHRLDQPRHDQPLETRIPIVGSPVQSAQHFHVVLWYSAVSRAADVLTHI